ncbi:MAG TPA: serine/threonine-protein kinase, partial [Aggregatilineaceae bacterium]|nr:serine/threonine-protein kinase [Aggregatilineaceae bacterium]
MGNPSQPVVRGRYRLDEVLGEGGMGTVYRGLDTHTGETIAIKLLKDDAVNLNTQLVERFNREAEALRQLNHPNIVKVITSLQDDNKRYIVMEYVGGGSLQDLLRRDGKLPLERVLTIGLELADALTRTHHLKIIHRDLKPANVLLAEDNSVRLTDFGIAQFAAKERVTKSGMIIGTPDYLCPEALQGGEVDQRADIWAFGVILFELLTGQRPFAGDNLSQVITSILTQPAPDLESLRPDTPPALVDLLYRMLEKDPTKRIPSVRLVGAELELILKGESELSTAFKSPGDSKRLPDKTSSASTPDTTPPDRKARPTINLAAGFQSLPPEHQNIVRLAQDQNQIEITPLQALAGGWSGAIVFLVSVAFLTSGRIEHLVLKLDRKNEKSQSDEIRRHEAAMRQSPPRFADQHLARMVFDRVEADGAIAIFYSIAGQSLHRYKTLSAYDKQSQVETIFAQTYQYILDEWNAARTFKQAVHPQALLEHWLSFRLKAGSNIETFLETVCHVPADIAGFLVQGTTFPNPLAYARHAEWWGTARPIDAAIGLQHGDMNTNNILIKFAGNDEALDGYYLID